MALTEISNTQPMAPVGHMSPHQRKATAASSPAKRASKARTSAPVEVARRAEQPPPSCAADQTALAAEAPATEEPNLQDAFAQFRAKRAKQLAKQKAKKDAAMKAVELRRRTDPKFQDELREKFVAGCRAYLGVPYAKSVAEKLCEEGDSDLEAERYLDCCGVVRQVLRDLSDEFGFDVGPWNQAYQWETLSENQLSGPEEMQPGDLIFTAGTYYSKDRKRQRHDMTHVEIFIGGESGEATIGSRKNAMVFDADTGLWGGDATRIGHVSVHPTYKFKSTGYTSDKYYFCSIKPWLERDCRPRKTDWVGQCPVAGEWIKATKEQGRSVTTAARSVFVSDECDDGGD